MSLVGTALWSMWLGDKPMPEGCTYEEMALMLDTIKVIEDREYAAEQIKWYEGLWRKYIVKYKQDQEGYTEIMKLIKQGILFWQGELTR